MTNELATTDQPQKLMLLDFMADKYSLRVEEFSKTVRATCGLATATPEQFAAFLIVAKSYDLNPLLKEIYAFPAKGGGVVPIVSIDGWVNLINSHPQLDGFEFEWEHDGKALISCTCKMYRKDRKFPVSVTEYLEECKRPTDPWKMQHRMLRHKTLMQAARYAFGFAGIYDEDEGRTIAEGPVDNGPPRGTALSRGEIIPDRSGMKDITPQADAAPPRQQAAPAQQEPETDDPEDDPPPHEHIPDGPGEDAAESDGDQPMAAQEPPQPTGPHTLDPIQGDTLKSWAKRFTDAIATSKTQAQVYEWHGLNKSGLDSVKTGAPAIFEGVKREMDGTLAALRERGSTVPKAAAKPAEPQADAGPPRKTAPGPLDAQMQGAVGGPNQPKSAKPDDILKWADQRLARIDDPENLAADIEAITTLYMPLLKLPPDVDEMQGIIRNHEKRLER